MFGLVDGEEYCADGEILSIDLSFFLLCYWIRLISSLIWSEETMETEIEMEKEIIRSVRWKSVKNEVFIGGRQQGG